MPFTLTMPKLSPTMEEGTIAKWRKNVGDFVEPGEVLFEVATDKATVEYNALDEGFLRTVLVHIGQSAKVGEPVAVFAKTKEEDVSAYKPVSLCEEKPEALEEIPPKEPAEAFRAPRSEKTYAQPSFVPEPPLEEYIFPFLEEGEGGRVKASPYVKKIAKEEGIDLSLIKGSGPGGRIVSEDIAYAPRSPYRVEKRADLPPGSYEEETLSPMRRVISTRLQQSKSFIPHFYVMQECDAMPIQALREQLKSGGVKVTVNDLLVKAVALTLRRHPKINSGFNSVSEQIIRFKTIDISIAVSVEEGLITPIVRHADCKNVAQISAEVQYLARKAKEGKLAREEYVGGSFTISNLGMFGITSFQGIINPPQAALLSIGGVQDKAVVKEEKVVPGKVITLGLSADHRVIDGADAALFMKDLRSLLENPALLLL